MSDSQFTLTPRRKSLRILSTSDWHLGNSRVPTQNIIRRLQTVIFPLLSKTDILNIGGDVWDTVLTLSNETNGIVSFIIDLLRECSTHNVTVRVLLGTYVHDRDQSTIFEICQEKCNFKNNLKYINQLCLEEIKEHDIRILYLPDDLPYESSDAVLEAVSELMSVRGWDWIDYVFGHGYFLHMIPETIPRKPKCLFKISQFKNIVRRYVCMGHVHMSDFTENVFYNNSFDRIAHGEELPKGCVYLEDFGTSAKIKFIENTQATKFVTIDLSSYKDKETIGQYYLEKVEKKFSEGEAGYVRVIHPSVEIRQALHRITTNKYPNLIYSFLKFSDDNGIDNHPSLRKSFDVSEYPTPTKETLPKMIEEFLEKNEGMSLSRIRIDKILSDL